MNNTLKQQIEAANKRAGLDRQRTFAKKSYLKQTDSALIGQLCDRADELLVALATNGDMRTACRNLRTAVTIARRQEGER